MIVFELSTCRKMRRACWLTIAFSTSLSILVANRATGAGPSNGELELFCEKGIQVFSPSVSELDLTKGPGFKGTIKFTLENGTELGRRDPIHPNGLAEWDPFRHIHFNRSSSRKPVAQTVLSLQPRGCGRFQLVQHFSGGAPLLTQEQLMRMRLAYQETWPASAPDFRPAFLDQKTLKPKKVRPKLNGVISPCKVPYGPMAFVQETINRESPEVGEHITNFQFEVFDRIRLHTPDRPLGISINEGIEMGVEKVYETFPNNRFDKVQLILENLHFIFVERPLNKLYYGSEWGCGPI